MKKIQRMTWMPANAHYITKDDAHVRAVFFWTKRGKPYLEDGIWTANKESAFGSIFFDEFPRGEIAKIKGV